MNNRRQSMRLGLVVLAGALIVLGGWLTTGPVALAEEEGHGNAVRVLAERIAGAQLTLVQAIQAAEKATGGVAIEAEYELEDDGLEIEVDVLVGEKIKEVEFDAMTGKMLVDDDEEGHDDDDEGEHEDDDDDEGHDDDDD